MMLSVTEEQFLAVSENKSLLVRFQIYCYLLCVILTPGGCRLVMCSFCKFFLVHNNIDASEEEKMS